MGCQVAKLTFSRIWYILGPKALLRRRRLWPALGPKAQTETLGPKAQTETLGPKAHTAHTDSGRAKGALEPWLDTSTPDLDTAPTLRHSVKTVSIDTGIDTQTYSWLRALRKRIIKKLAFTFARAALRNGASLAPRSGEI